MKKLIILSLILTSFMAKGQDLKQTDPFQYFVLQNQTIHYIKIYSDSIDSTSVIIEKLFKQLNETTDLTGIQIVGNTITGQISETKTSTANAVMTGENGFSWTAQFFIEIKDGKYRVDVHAMMLHSGGTYTAEQLYTKKYGTEWKKSAHLSLAARGYQYDKYFTLATQKKSTW